MKHAEGRGRRAGQREAQVAALTETDGHGRASTRGETRRSANAVQATSDRSRGCVVRAGTVRAAGLVASVPSAAVDAHGGVSRKRDIEFVDVSGARVRREVVGRIPTDTRLRTVISGHSNQQRRSRESHGNPEQVVVVAAETIQENIQKLPEEPPFNPNDPIDLPEDMNILDLTNATGTLFGLAISTIRNFLVGSVDNVTGTEDLQINALLGGVIPEEVVSGASFEIVGFNIVIESVQIVGLDSFTNFDILDPIAPQVLQNTFELDNESFEF